MKVSYLFQQLCIWSLSDGSSLPLPHVILLLGQSCTSPKSLRHAAYKSRLVSQVSEKSLSSQGPIYGYPGSVDARQTHRWNNSVTP